VVGGGRVEETSMEEWRRVMDANLTSAFVVARAVLPGMMALGGGSIVFMSSLNARDGGTSLSGPPYAAAKAGVLGLMRHIARNYASEGVRANAIAPGPVATAMHDRLAETEKAWLRSLSPLGRVSNPEEIADMVLFLLSSSCASVTGLTFDVNGGSYMS
jgi:NAD(P)-dependent dehydrogenase (short-subunit alcohol dehydrogenase family)